MACTPLANRGIDRSEQGEWLDGLRPQQLDPTHYHPAIHLARLATHPWIEPTVALVVCIPCCPSSLIAQSSTERKQSIVDYSSAQTLSVSKLQTHYMRRVVH
jgi:hypothetical protein